MEQLTIQSLGFLIGIQEVIIIIVIISIITIIIIIIIVILACLDARCESGQTSGSCHMRVYPLLNHGFSGAVYGEKRKAVIMTNQIPNANVDN